MNYFLKNVETGTRVPSPVMPTWFSGMWHCGDSAVTDTTGTQYEAVEEPEVMARHITVLAFRNRFTQAEKVTMEIAALDNPAATMPQRQQAAAIRASMKDTQAATYIDLDRADTRAGVIQLETGGLLAAGRAAHILDDEIQDVERYRV